MCSIALDLLVRGNGTEDDLSELATFEGAVCDSSNDLKGLFDNSH
jgi:hypothetical protein